MRRWSALPSASTVRPEIVVAPETPNVVTWRLAQLTPPGFVAGPSDRFVTGRVMCREGFLAIVSCSGGVSRKETMGPVCEQIIGSLTIEAESAAQAPGNVSASPDPATGRPANAPQEI
jgi:hypothetical protein